MKNNSPSISTCKNCRCFRAEGRRGGTCGRFETFTESEWSICSLAEPIFAEIQTEKRELVFLEKSFALSVVGENAKLPIAKKTACLETTQINT